MRMHVFVSKHGTTIVIYRIGRRIYYQPLTRCVMESLLLGNICQMKTFNCQSKLMEGSEVRSVGTRISVGFSEWLWNASLCEVIIRTRTFQIRVCLSIINLLLIFPIVMTLSWKGSTGYVIFVIRNNCIWKRHVYAYTLCHHYYCVQVRTHWCSSLYSL